MNPRAVVFLTVALCLGSGGRDLQAQDSVRIDQFRPPAAPAFVLLGVEPVSVERPSTPQAFAATMLAASDELTLLPRNYAIEVAPYWLARHPTLEFDQYYSGNAWQTFLQTLSFSFATVSADTGVAGTSVGLGFRALLARGRAPDLADSLRAVQQEMLDEEDPERLRALDQVQQGLVARFHEADLRRVGGRFELAAAATMQFPSQRFENGRLRRVGIWTTYSYQLEKPRLDVTVVAPSAKERAFFEEHAALIRSLAALERMEVVAEATEQPQTIRHAMDTLDLRIPMAGLFDIAAEMTRLSKERLKIEAELAGLQGKLDNPQFVARAKPEVVAQSRERVAELLARRTKVDGTLADLRGGGE